ncbi:methyltransferase domain-containing protein [Candidatus Bathyarchaeota archaeon]|nr:methyltransferase domain-containing protein [Candidatus Bathyarchaeota archaeon]
MEIKQKLKIRRCQMMIKRTRQTRNESPGTTEKKPRYGFIAIRPFLTIGIVGVAGWMVAITGILRLEGLGRWVTLTVAGMIGIIGTWVAVSYIPLYFLVLRPRGNENFWANQFTKHGISGKLVAIDAGCGTGQVTIEVAKALPDAHVTGIDIFKGMSGTSPGQPTRNAKIEGVSDRVTFKKGNLLDLPFPDNSVDVVTVGSVLHEIDSDENRKAALEEIKRVLKPGGYFFTVELLRDWRMILAMLVFAPVWKTGKYWKELLLNAGYSSLDVGLETRMLNMGVYCMQK